jgi:N-acetylmuramic acid 6-phosphate etherase
VVDKWYYKGILSRISGENHVSVKATEQLHDEASGLDVRPSAEIAKLLAEAQIAAAISLRDATASICSGASAMAYTVRRGGVLHYVAAGSSGLMAASDALELGGTFSIPASQIRIHMAGGQPIGVEMPGGTEDETDELQAALRMLGPLDTVIAVSASGSTPYTIAAARIAQSRRATLIGVANNAGSQLLELADHPILLSTPPEVISGSTRMGAGTAQKIALNMLSTLMAVELGHVHDGMMVNLRADNTKLHERARGIVARIAGVAQARAVAALEISNGDVKTAILVAARDVTPDLARSLLKETGGHIRPALARLE